MVKLARQAIVPVLGALALWGAVPAHAASVAKWRQGGLPVISSKTVKWSGKIKLSDTNVPLFHTVGAECEETAAGEVGPNGAGEVNGMTLSNCVSTANCPSPTAQALNLPWGSELAVVEGAANDRLISSGKGEPEFKLTCNGSGFADECKGRLGAAMANTESAVTATFLSSEKLACSKGGAGSGTVEGAQSVASSGEWSKRLSVVVEEPPKWLAGGKALSSPAAVTLEGELKLFTKIPLYGSANVTCKDTGTGKVGAGGAGEVTSLAMTSCYGGGICASRWSSLEARYLPWPMELFRLEGGGGIGELPLSYNTGVVLTCEIGVERVKEECDILDFTLTNGESGVTATVSKEVFCLTYNGTAEGSQTIKLTSGERLSVS